MSNVIDTEIETEENFSTKLFKKRGIYNVNKIDGFDQYCTSGGALSIKNGNIVYRK